MVGESTIECKTIACTLRHQTPSACMRNLGIQLSRSSHPITRTHSKAGSFDLKHHTEKASSSSQASEWKGGCGSSRRGSVFLGDRPPG